MPWIGTNLKDILCVQEERTVRPDNCVAYQNKLLQIPADRHRCHYVKANVRVHEYPDHTLAIFHGPRCLARYDANGQELKTKTKVRCVRAPDVNQRRTFNVLPKPDILTSY